MLNSFKHTRQLQIMENMNYPGNSWEGCLSWLPSRRRPILSGAPYPQISPHPGQLKILRIHVHVLLSLIYPLHCFISIVDAWDLLEFMIYQSCSEGRPLFLALRILKGLASYCKAETTFTFHFAILTLSNASFKH